VLKGNFYKGRNSATGKVNFFFNPVDILRALINSDANIQRLFGPFKPVLYKFYYSKIVKKMLKPLLVLHFGKNL